MQLIFRSTALAAGLAVALLAAAPAFAQDAQEESESAEDQDGAEDSVDDADTSGSARDSTDDIDSLFDEPDPGLTEDGAVQEGTVGEEEAQGEEGESDQAQDSGSEDGVDIGALTTMPLTVGGNVTASAGLNLGFEEWPTSDAAEDREPSDLLRRSIVYDMTSTLKFDARPAPYLRFFTSLKTDLDSDRMRFTGPDIDEVFVDYTLAGRYFFRLGDQNLTWGQARLLGNPANLVDRVSDGISFRGTGPLGPGSLTGVVYSIAQWIGDEKGQYRKGSPRAFAYAGLYEATVGPITFEVSTHYKKAELTGSAASLTFGLGPVDVTAEGRGDWDNEDVGAGIQEFGTLGQLFWESDSGGWSLLGEYEFDSKVPKDEGHYVGVATQAPELIGDWRPRIRWRHAFQDDSGEVIPAFGGTVAPKLKATFTTPIIYGKPGTFYREEFGADEDEQGLPFQGEEVLQFLVGVQLSFSF